MDPQKSIPGLIEKQIQVMVDRRVAEANSGEKVKAQELLNLRNKVAKLEARNQREIDRIKKQFEAEKKDLEKTLNAGFEKQLNEILEQSQTAIQGMQDELDSVYQERDNALNEVKRLTQLQSTLENRMLQPKMFGSPQTHAQIGNELISHLWQKELIFDSLESEENDTGYRIRLEARQPIDPAELMKLSQYLELATDSPPNSLKIQRDTGKKFTFNFKVRQPAEAIETEASNPHEWLRDLILTGSLKGDRPLKIQHLRCVGGTGSGKSVTLNNCKKLIEKQLPDVLVELADPLAENGQSDWDFEPTYSGYEESAQAVLDLSAEVDKRREGRAEVIPQVLIVDEIDGVIATLGENARDFEEALKNILKAGRHQKCWIWLAGQSADVWKKIRFTLNDYQNLSWLGFNDGGLDLIKKYQVPNAVSLKRDYGKMQQKGHEYIAYVRPALGSHKILLTPPPGAWEAIEPRDIQESGEIKQIKRLIDEGLTDSQICLEVFQLKQSRSSDYKAKIDLIKSLRED